MNFTTSIAWYRNPRELGLLPDLGHDLLGDVPEVIKTTVFGKEIEFEATSMSDNVILSLLVLTVVKFFRCERSQVWRITAQFTDTTPPATNPLPSSHPSPLLPSLLLATGIPTGGTFSDGSSWFSGSLR